MTQLKSSHPQEVLDVLRRHASDVKAEFSGYWTGPEKAPMVFFRWSASNPSSFVELEDYVRRFSWFDTYNEKFTELSRGPACSMSFDKPLVLVQASFLLYLPPIEEENFVRSFFTT